VVFRSTFGRRNMEEMVEDQVPQEFPVRAPSVKCSKARENFFGGSRNVTGRKTSKLAKND
jgi:hypothetical protein